MRITKEENLDSSLVNNTDVVLEIFDYLKGVFDQYRWYNHKVLGRPGIHILISSVAQFNVRDVTIRIPSDMNLDSLQVWSTKSKLCATVLHPLKPNEEYTFHCQDNFDADLPVLTAFMMFIILMILNIVCLNPGMMGAITSSTWCMLAGLLSFSGCIIIFVPTDMYFSFPYTVQDFSVAGDNYFQYRDNATVADIYTQSSVINQQFVSTFNPPNDPKYVLTNGFNRHWWL